MIRRLWQTSPELVGTAALMLPVLAGAVAGLAFDPTVIAGAPAWLKPAKFAVSIAIYTLTLAWIFTFLPAWPRTRRVIGWATALTMGLEMGIIGTQAWRGTTSHFNVSTPADGIAFGVMGAAIVAQTLSTIAVAVALWRTRFADRSLGWALRFGMALTIAGALTGGLMTRPTAAQLDAARAGAPMTTAGAHTVGGRDGGPGLPGTGWSTEHGDVRVPHFVGLHALQALAIVALLLGRAGLRDKVRERLVLVAAASYAGLFGILLIQAFRGVPLVAPDSATLVQLTTWAIATVAAASLTWFTNVRQPRAITTI
ncbi:MAG TPA: hypothetical protein VL263_07415 [Vicinamibacterales bacterium]|nr:hypothetical protein [Vicinamibacterales bacterium]